MLTGSPLIDAESAFDRVNRARRRAALVRRVRGRRGGQLRVYERGASGLPARIGRRELPLDQICGTVEPFRANLFDGAFRPAPAARRRWQRIWLAEDRGTVLPPITVVPVGETYAVRDGHHRVSVALARGAVSIDAIVDAA
jgi:hypothetical protein